MSKQQASTDETKDEHGLVVHRYVSTVLVVMPAEQYAETTLRYARSALYNVHVGTRSVATDDTRLLKGDLQDEFQVDGKLSGERMEPYSGVIFVGGRGALVLAQDADALRLAREAMSQEKLVAAWGHALSILAAAGVVRGKRVTGDPSLEATLRRAGARYSGAQLERDGTLVTGYDDASGFRFGKALAQVVGI
jgi:protease I